MWDCAPVKHLQRLSDLSLTMPVSFRDDRMLSESSSGEHFKGLKKFPEKIVRDFHSQYDFNVNCMG